MKTSRSSASLAEAENSGVEKNAPGEVGSAVSRPLRTT